ncbi:MAG TPA: type IV toxin-antitoxin system AbiEi family antitoxin domain-containing protein [Anaerolineales bacterium]|nr:type IV toxin-antitoxin system AbiEi family antitoxin domain-containing protein [Anaerolineales bacterium]
MIVKDALSPLDRTRKILEGQNGTLLTTDLAKFNIPRTYLSILERNGEIERVSRGVYQAKDAIKDDLFSIQAACRSAVYSHETALYLHDLTDRSPLRYSLTVPVGYHSSSLIQSGHKIFYVNRSMFGLGVITLKSPHGNPIRVTDLERTICDIVRSRNQMDMQIVYEALRCYVKRTDRDVDLLYNYAGRFRVQKIIRQYIESLL